MKTIHVGLCAVLLGACCGSFGSLAWASETEDPRSSNRVRLDVPVLEHPFNTTQGAWPSMRQSLQLSRSVNQAANIGVGLLIDPDGDGGFARKVGLWSALIATDTVLINLPLGSSWLHEEWHRAQLSNRGMDSYDEVYEFEVASNVIKVSHVRDKDLAELKRHHNAELVRLSSAGIEAQYEMNTALSQEHFFAGTRNLDAGTMWWNFFGATGYVNSSVARDDALEDEMEKEEKDELDKDFVGHDFRGWVYDLFRSDEAYSKRGIHQNASAGVRRYRRTSDLTKEEKNYLSKMAALQYLNGVDPFLFGVDRMQMGEVDFNVNLRHFLTSFGHAWGAQIYWSGFAADAFVRGYVGCNRNACGPIASATLYDLSWLGDLSFSPTVAIWNQPKEQSFRTEDFELGGMLGADFGFNRMLGFDPILSVEAKSSGWFPGMVSLEPAVNTRLTLRVSL